MYQLNEMAIPLVWTMHDVHPMTGGCHYLHGCSEYKNVCRDCPQMRNNKHGYPELFLRLKKKYLPKSLVVVSPSRWLAKCASESAVFSGHRIEII